VEWPFTFPSNSRWGELRLAAVVLLPAPPFAPAGTLIVTERGAPAADLMAEDAASSGKVGFAAGVVGLRRIRNATAQPRRLATVGQ
jgi:hypothetical protein